MLDDIKAGDVKEFIVDLLLVVNTIQAGEWVYEKGKRLRKLLKRRKRRKK